MRKNITILATVLATAWLGSCSVNLEKSENAPTDIRPDKVIPADEIDRFVVNKLQKEGQFWWASAPVEMVWSALQQSEKVLSVGYKPANEGNIDQRIHEIDIKAAEWRVARQQILDIVWEEERKLNPNVTMEQLFAYPENELPVLDLNVESFLAVKRLRESNLTRYVEPMGYQPQGFATEKSSKVQSSSGCGSNTAESGLVAGSDFTVTTPNNTAKVSWNFAFHGIQNAWTKSSGIGVKTVCIDTGASDGQAKLGSQFNQGLSSGRTIEKLVTLPRSTFLGIPTGPVETPNDGCGHGTSMMGAAYAPRGTDGTNIGVAYNTNLISIRAAEDVFLDASRENRGVSDAFVLAGNRTDVRIIHMSMGNIISNSQVADGVRYAFNRGKMIFCAGGTSFGWTAGWAGVIFPASMSEAIAVTGVKDNLTQRCDACHDGGDIEFVVVMEKASNGRKPLSLAQSGNTPSTVGGSSVATATTAGMAALVWSRMQALGQNPTRASVYERLRANASNASSRHPQFGWGRINVDAATN
jgi:Subtilase family